MEIQKVSLDCIGIRPESGTVANVGDGIEAFLSNASPRDVHAVAGDQFLIARKVDGRNGVFRTVSPTAARSRNYAKGPGEKNAGAVHITGTDQLPNAGTGHGGAADPHLGIRNNFKSKFAAKLGEEGNVASCFVSKMEVVALVDFESVKAVAKDLLREFAGAHQR
jgi:hypothetical protein